jgi:hypothetical protein
LLKARSFGLFIFREKMSNVALKLQLHKFGNGDPLHSLDKTQQVKYLIDYFGDLSAESVLEEPNYFDRDYLAEFSAFYAVSSRGYPNVCRRIHVFSCSVNRQLVRRASQGNKNAIHKLRSTYLGFVVIRPIKVAPLGRTVVVWYPENKPAAPRITEPMREYSVHIAGFTLRVQGLAWQQQDTGVGACATVGLWTMLHSSAFDDHHAIPTTAQITKTAHSTASLGARIFPSKGLTIEQICEAIKRNKLAPMVFGGDARYSNGNVSGFSRVRFSAACASLIRSGYPVLIAGVLEGVGAHASCAVGFRSSVPTPPQKGSLVNLQESDIGHIYIHDDNIGPNVRFEICEDATDHFVRLKHSAPPPNSAINRLNTAPYPDFIPLSLVVAVHEDLRTSPDQLHQCGLKKTVNIFTALSGILKFSKQNPMPLSFSTRFIKLSEYINCELENTLGDNPGLLGKVRLALCEKVPPMSLHIGVVRIGLWNATPLMDVLFDTTDSDRNHPVFAHVCYQSISTELAIFLTKTKGEDFGISVKAF